MKKKVCVVTGSRSEYGILYHILEKIKTSKDLELLLVVTGAHLSKEMGYTVNEIIRDGFNISRRVKMPLSCDRSVDIARATGAGVMGFSGCFKKLAPDMLLILGDRFEIFSAATAAMLMNLPIVHISGGDVTEGMIDEQIRHAITKMSHIHFVALASHAERVKQMGEEPWRVSVVGEPCIDRINNMKKISKKRLESLLKIRLSHPVFVITFHPAAARSELVSLQTENLLKAIDKFDAQMIFTYPNADSGRKVIISQIKLFADKHSNAAAFESLGSHLYYNLLCQTDVLIGNSSSAIVEAPSFKLPAVNIGERQNGRLMPKNIICTSQSHDSISKGIEKALRPSFRKHLSNIKNPYGRGNTAEKIVKTLSGLKIDEKLLKKRFITVN